MGTAGAATRGNPAEDITVINEHEEDDASIHPEIGCFRTQDQQRYSKQGLLTPEEAWTVKNLLSLDGGGIRGLWSLYSLRLLMEFIRDEEEEFECVHPRGRGACSSFSPHEFSANIASEPPAADQRRESLGGSIHCPIDIKPSKRYLPCHYFDYICGSSTGGLIALMLGRFRMTVEDCIDEYYSLGDQIFGRPRHITTLNFGVINRYKYKTSRLEEVYKQFCKRRETANHKKHPILLPAKSDLCKTFVTTFRRGEGRTGEESHLLRSYDQKAKARGWRRYEEDEHEPDFVAPGVSRANTDFTQAPTRANTDLSEMVSQGIRHTSTEPSNTQSSTSQSDQSQPQPGVPRVFSEPVPERPRRRKTNRPSTVGDTIAKWKRNINHGPADAMEVWKVARAATAADFHFKPLKEDGDLYTDGAFGPTINPTHEGVLEIEETWGIGKIHVVVSVGTARQVDTDKKGIIKWVKKIVNDLTDPELINGHVKRDLAAAERKNPKFFRFNDPGALGLELDDWRPRHNRLTRKKPGSKTIEEIYEKWKDWAVENKNRGYLQACATSLVRCRRARMKNEAMWERFALGAEFMCPEPGCPEPFLNRDIFRKHLEEKHRYAFKGKQGEDDEIDRCRTVWNYQKQPDH